MLQMDFAFFNVESIRGFTSTFVAICSATSYPFGFPSRSKRPPLENLKFLVTALRNQDKKVALIRVDEDEALSISSEFMRTYHNMNIIVQNTFGDASSINGKSESPNKTDNYSKFAHRNAQQHSRYYQSQNVTNPTPYTDVTKTVGMYRANPRLTGLELSV